MVSSQAPVSETETTPFSNSACWNARSSACEGGMFASPRPLQFVGAKTPQVDEPPRLAGPNPGDDFRRQEVIHIQHGRLQATFVVLVSDAIRLSAHPIPVDSVHVAIAGRERRAQRLLRPEQMLRPTEG